MLTIKETAIRLNLKVRTIRDWIRRGWIHAEKLNGSRMWSISEDEISRILKEREDKKNDNKN